MQRWNGSTFSLLALVVAAVTLSTHARAQEDADELMRQIQARSAKIKEFRALLNDPDQVTRLAALDVMLKSNDVAMQELAFGVCFNSADQAMQVLCLKNKLAQMKTIAVTLKEKAERTKPEAKALADWGGVYSFSIKSFDENTGQFATEGSYRKGTGQVTGLRVEFAHPYCNGSFELIEGGVLDGELGCTGGWAGRFPAAIRLQ